MAKVLVIDDDEAFRTMLRMTLTTMGHEVAEATDGKAGTRIFREWIPDVVMTDLVMPQKEGLETIRDLRRASRSVKIIAMSGGTRHFNAHDFLTAAKLLGANRTLKKPFWDSQLGDALAALLPER